MSQSNDLSLDELLADAAWVRRLAAALVSEPADAEDVAQLTFVAAIERPPARTGEQRRWLAAVARNVARMMGRGAARRMRREVLAEADSVAPSPEALVERAQLQRQLATLLTELEEPYRTTVLLCYFEELSPFEIARRLGIPAATVRSRLKRGLDHLRARLDRLHASRRAGWLLPMSGLGRASHARHLSLPMKGMVIMANKTAIAAGVGALVAATALVGVNEARVLVAQHHAHSEQTLENSKTQPTQVRFATSVAAIAAHLPPPAAGATREELLERDAEQRAEIVRLRAEVAALRGPQPFDMPPAWKSGEDYFKPSKDELLQMAKGCQVRFDAPELTVPAATMRDGLAAEAGVSDEERQQYNRVLAEFTQTRLAQLRSIYVEVTGDKSGADTLSPDAMMNEIRLKVPEAAAQEAYWKVSHERAGLLPASTDASSASAFERWLRLQENAGDAFETALGATLGADRAHALRTEEGSWGARMMLGSCPKGR